MSLLAFSQSLTNCKKTMHGLFAERWNNFFSVLEDFWGRQRNIYLRMVISCHSSSLRIANSACCLHGMLQQWSERCSEAFTTVPAHRVYSVNVGCYYYFLTSSSAMWIFSWLFKFSACSPLFKIVTLILVWYNKKLIWVSLGKAHRHADL